MEQNGKVSDYLTRLGANEMMDSNMKTKHDY